jgi:hypothetical protein
VGARALSVLAVTGLGLARFEGTTRRGAGWHHRSGIFVLLASFWSLTLGWRELGSGLIAQSQKITVAAMQIADMKV